jgi:hypothetical protein
MNDWIEFLSSQYRAGGFVSKARRGEYDIPLGERLCDALERMDLAAAPADFNLLRQFVARIWYMPILLERQTEHIARRGGDVWRYRELTANVTSAVLSILSHSDPMMVSVEGADALPRSDDRERFITIAKSIFDDRLAGFGFRRIKVGPSLVRYESEAMFVNVRFRPYAARPRIEVGRLFDIGGLVFGIGDILEAFVGAESANMIWVEATRKLEFDAFVAALADLLISHCREVLEGDSRAFQTVSSFYSKRNNELRTKILECAGYRVPKR